VRDLRIARCLGPHGFVHEALLASVDHSEATAFNMIQPRNCIPSNLKNAQC